MKIYRNDIKQQWIESSVLGTLWGSFEIIVGSFLHNIRFPMSGTILASFTVILLTSYGVLYNKKGIFWRASLIAALMKSISPSAVLLGPMTGIIMEGFLMELAIFLLGSNLLGFIFAGILALYSVLIHKIITLLVLYGFNIIKISENFYYFIIKILNIKNLGFWQALGYLSLIYVLTGIFAATVGFLAGKKALKIKDEKNILNLKFKPGLQNSDENQSLSFMPLIFHLIALILSIWLMSVSRYGILVSVAYVIFTGYKYGNSLKRLKKVGIWIQFAILFVISALFYKFSEAGANITKEGIYAGTEMIVRSFVIIFAFAAISTHLRSPLVKIILFKNGFRDLYLALSLSFSALPELINNFEIKKFFKNPLDTVIKQILSVKRLSDEFAGIVKKRKIFVITGEVNSGKTTLLKKIIPYAGNDLCGFISEADSDKKENFFIIDLKSGQKQLLCSKSNKISETRVGKYYFSHKGIEFGKQLIRKASCQYLIIDEIGPLELRGGGWSDAIDDAFEKKNITQIWIVRKAILTRILKRFAIFEAVIFDTNDNIDNIKKEIFYSKNS